MSGEGNNDLGLPDFLDRTNEVEQPKVPEPTTTGFGPAVAAATEEPQLARDEVTGQTAEEAGIDLDAAVEASTTPVGGQDATIASAPSQVEAAQEQLVNPEATEGHNNAPMDREEMLKEFNKTVAAFGKDSGKGASALPKLGLLVVRAAYDGLVSTDKPKDGSESDAVRIYKRYAEQDSKHAEHTNGGMKANASKLNSLIGLGSMTTVDGVDVADRCVKLREKMEEADAKPKPLFAGLVDVARAQMAQDTVLTDAQIEDALVKKPADKTLAKEWAAIAKKVEALCTGENPAGLKDDSDIALAIHKQIEEHINNFGSKAEREEQIAFCMERGMTRAQAEEFVANK